MSKTSINKLLPTNVYQALINANSPSAVNPYATIADLSGATTIYTGDGALTANRTVTQAGFWLNFTGGNISIGFAGAPVARVDVRGADSLSSTYAFRVSDVADTLLFNVANDGFVGVGISAPAVNVLSRFTVRDLGSPLWCEFMDGVDTNTGLIFRKDSDISAMAIIGTRNGLNADDITKYAGIGFNNANGYLAFGGYPYAGQKYTFNLNYQGNNAQERFNVNCGLHTIDTGPIFNFSGAPDSASNTQVSYGSFEILKENAVNANFAAYMRFLTSNNASLVEAMRITSAQYIGIGETVPTARLHVKTQSAGFTDGVIINNSSSTALFRIQNVGDAFFDNGGVFIRTRSNAYEAGIAVRNLANDLVFNVFSNSEMTFGFGADITTRTTDGRWQYNNDIETLLNTIGLIVLDRTDANRYRIYTDGGVVMAELVP